MSARKVLAYYYVEAEKGIGNECRSMSYDMVLCCHVILLLKFCDSKFTYFSLPLFITFQVRMKAIEVGELLETVEWDYPSFYLNEHCFICCLPTKGWWGRLNLRLFPKWKVSLL